MTLTNAIMDLILMALLIAALVFGLRLHRNVKLLRAGQEDFARSVHELDAAAIRAHASLRDLRGSADESQDLLHGRILAARELMQKLDQQVARAERVQRELETGLGTAATLHSLRARPSGAEAPRHADDSNARRPFDRDVVADDAPLVLGPQSRLPGMAPDDGNESELLEKVHMSELVVANLNEMIRSFTLPTRQPEKSVMSMEDDLFGAEVHKK